MKDEDALLDYLLIILRQVAANIAIPGPNNRVRSLPLNTADGPSDDWFINARQAVAQIPLAGLVYSSLSYRFEYTWLKTNELKAL